MNFCKHKYFVIYRGDDTDFPGNQELIVEINTTRDLTGCSAHFQFQGFTQDFADIPSDKKLHLIFPSFETKKFALGASDAKLWLTSGTKIRTVESRIHIVVTNRVDEAYDNDDPQAITVTISGGGGGATVVLDDTVTETSSNGVKSSGIWSWVKSLLPHWLTSDYAEPATAASVAKKADKTALDNHIANTDNPHVVTAEQVGALRYQNSHGTFYALYVNENGGDWGFYKQGALFLLPHGEGAVSGGVLALRSDLSALDLKADEITRFTWTSEDPDIPDGWIDLANSPNAPQPEFAGGYWSCGAIGGCYVVTPARGTEDDLTFTLGFAYDATETVFEATATRKRVLRTGDAATPNELAQIASEVQSKRPLTDNICHQSQLGNVWTCDPPLPEGYEIARYSEGIAGWQPNLNGNSMGVGKQDPGNTATTLSWAANEWQGGYAFTATRTAVAKSGEPFVTEGSISTNNPAFVSAVRNTPTSGMPDDMPTDWGIFGTVGAALAALAAGLKWCKNILGSLASGYSTFAAWIASKLDRASLLTEYSATSAYSVGAIVYHDGSIYQCTTAIADGGEAWNAEHWELRKLDDFFTESNSLLTGTIDARLPYPLNAVTGETGLLKDRAINTTSLASVTVPDNFTDLLVRASVASSLSVTMPEAIVTKYGDTFPGGAGEYLITITRTGAAEAYVRTIKLEEVA